MNIQIKAPLFPESVTEALISAIHVEIGEEVLRDQLIFDIETEKVILEVVAPADGKITHLAIGLGDHITSNQVIGDFLECEVSKTRSSSTLEEGAARSISDMPQTRTEINANEIVPVQEKLSVANVGWLMAGALIIGLAVYFVLTP